MSISLKVEHLQRYRQIARLFFKYGRKDLLNQSGLDSLELEEEGSAPSVISAPAKAETGADVEVRDHAHRREIVERLVHGLERNGGHVTHHFGPDDLGRWVPTGRRDQRLEDALPLRRDLETLRSKLLDELAGRLHGRNPSRAPRN